MYEVVCYIDGFNFYHAIDDLQRPHLKWVDLWSLAKSICRKNEILVKVAYFSAYAEWMQSKVKRHKKYVQVLESSNVTCHIARFSEKEMKCRKCNARWISREEKETDVHFALTFLEDAFDDIFHRAIIVSADGDYVPAVRLVRRRFPEKEIFIAAPPKRLGRARELVGVASGRMQITPGRIARNLLPERVQLPDGTTVTRPHQYDPPAEWTPPA